MNFKAHLLTSAAVGVAIPLTWKMAGINLTEPEIAYMVTATILGGNFADLGPKRFFSYFRSRRTCIGSPQTLGRYQRFVLGCSISKHHSINHSKHQNNS